MVEAAGVDAPARESSSASEDRTWVRAIHRFAVKGLDRDVLSSTTLRDRLPDDRRFALIYDEHAPLYGARPLLRERLNEPDGASRVGAFFSNASGRAVRIVDGGALHQFGNTGSGVKASGDVRTLHIINANTVRALSAAAGVQLDPSRFRANIIVDGALPAWREFEWVGSTVVVGAATLRVVSRTVRCDGVNVDAEHGSGRADLDIPALLQRHFPQHGPFLGVYAQVTGGEARVQLGDAVHVAV